MDIGVVRSTGAAVVELKYVKNMELQEAGREFEEIHDWHGR